MHKKVRDKKLEKTQKKAKRECIIRSSFFVFFLMIFFQFHTFFTQRVYQYKLLISDGFVEYIPYALFFIFIFVNKKSILHFFSKKHKSEDYKIAFFFLAFFFSFLSARQIPFLEKNIDTILVEYIIYFLIASSVFLGTFGIAFAKKYIHSLSILLLLIVSFKLSPLLIDHFWQYSSRVSMFGLQLLLPLSHLNYVMDASRFNVSVEDFSLFIGPPCAGIHSLVAFATLFWALLLLAQERGYRIQYKVAIPSFFLGLLLVFVVNSLRVFSIILVGIFYSRDFAVTLFHSFIGAFLLILFFILYIHLLYPKMIKVDEKQEFNIPAPKNKKTS